MLLIICTILILVFTILMVKRFVRSTRGPNEPGVAILVLADIGLCPRMQNHALAITQSFPERDVYFIGYLHSQCRQDLISNPHIKLFRISGDEFLQALKSYTRNLLFPIYATLKIIIQLSQIVWILSIIPKYKTMIIQNPPTIPTLAIAWLACRLRGANMIIDWHNYGFSLLKMTLDSINSRRLIPILEIATFFEKFFGRLSNFNLCVSKSMQADLYKNWSIHSEVLYDKPSLLLMPISLLSKHMIIHKYFNFEKNQPKRPKIPSEELGNLLGHLSMVYLEYKPTHLRNAELYEISKENFNSLVPSNNLLDSIEDDDYLLEDNKISDLSISKKLNNYVLTVRNKPTRPAILLTSTSWTPDENIHMLLEALRLYDLDCSGAMKGHLPDLFLIITGKNPDLLWFEHLKEMSLQNVVAISIFSPMEDYYKMVALADIGISLHTSSSGLDLPMKIVDMQGAGLPVLAYHFETIIEQISLGKNAETFTDPETLKHLLVDLLIGFPSKFDEEIIRGQECSNNNRLFKMRLYAEQNRPIDFNQEWSKIVQQYII